MKIDTSILRNFLNYDTHTEQFLSYIERIEIHKAIQRDMNGWSFALSPKLTQKVKPVLAKMKRTKWQSTRGAYKEDKQTGTIKFNEI